MTHLRTNQTVPLSALIRQRVEWLESKARPKDQKEKLTEVAPILSRRFEAEELHEQSIAG